MKSSLVKMLITALLLTVGFVAYWLNSGSHYVSMNLHKVKSIPLEEVVAARVDRTEIHSTLEVSFARVSTLPKNTVFSLSIIGPPESKWERVARVAAESGFQVELETAGPYFVRATAPGWICSGQWVEIQLGGSHRQVILKPEPGRSVSGQVVDLDGVPIGGAEIHAVRGGKSFHTGSFSNAQGQFDFTIAQGGSDPLDGFMALAVGYLPGVHPLPKAWDLSTRFVLQRGRTVSGRVVRADTSIPLSDVAIHWAPAERILSSRLWGPWAEESWVAKTDEEGRFELGGMLDLAMELFFTAEGMANATYTLESGTADISILVVIEDGTEFRARLVNEKGEFVSGASVKLVQPDHKGKTVVHKKTDGAGEFSMSGLAHGAYRLFSEAEGYSPQSTDLALPLENDSVVEIVMLPSPVLKGGLSTPASGLFQYRVELRKEDESYRWSENFETPEFQFAECMPGDYQVWIQASGSSAEWVGSVYLEPGKETDLGLVTLSESGPSVYGRVEADDTRLPVMCSVRLSGSLNYGMQNGVTFETKTLVDGSFSFHGVPDGEYYLFLNSLSKQYGDPLRSILFQQVGQRSQDLGTFTLVGSGALSVEVLDQGGQIVMNPEISTHSGSTLSFGNHSYGSNPKEFWRGGYSAGRIKATYQDGGNYYSAYGEIISGETTHLVIDLGNFPSVTWRCKLLSENGNPFANAEVSLAAADGSWFLKRSKTDASGTLEFSGPLKGDTVLTAFDVNTMTALPMRLVHFRGNGKGPSTIHYEGGSISAIGRPGSSAVRLFDLGWESQSLFDKDRAKYRSVILVRTQPGKRFSFEHLPAGIYSIRWGAGDDADATSSTQVTLAKGEHLDLDLK